MKLQLTRKTFVALALAVATTVGNVVTASAQPAPPPTGDVALPPGIAPDSQLAQVLKLAQAGVDESVMRSFVENSTGAFDLDADKIIALKDAGVPTDIINAMLERDKAVYAASATPPPAPPASVASAPNTAPPVTPVTVNYFTETLTPYGSWVEVDGYGRCWRPTVVNYDSTWRPYCDRGRWVYTDCGWYWDSDYSWGVTFHYGRWFRNPRFGWCWYPDTVWGPSWVTFRSSSDYCGWAPLPPLAVFRPGLGFFYRGASVSIGFDFGLDAGCYTFISPDRFCDRRPRYYAAPPQRVTQIFQQTTVINNYNIRNTTIVNNGISVQQINRHTPRPIEPVNIASLPNATRQGWRGEGSDRHGRSDIQGNNAGNNNGSRNVSGGSSQPGQRGLEQNRSGNQRNGERDISAARPTPPVAPENRGANKDRKTSQDRSVGNRNPQPISQPSPVIGAPVENRGQTVNRADQRNVGQAGGHNQQPQIAAPPGNNVVAERSQRQITPQPNINNRIPPDNSSRVTHEQTPPRQFNAPSAPAYGAPVTRPPLPTMPRQATPPEQRQPNAALPAVRSYTPPPQPAPAPAPSQTRGSDRSSERGSGRNSDRDK